MRIRPETMQNTTDFHYSRGIYLFIIYLPIFHYSVQIIAQKTGQV